MLSILGLVLGVTTFFFTRKLKMAIRIFLAILIFVICNVPTVAMLYVGDQARPGATTIQMK
jgi:hypothetical protein